MTSNNGRDSSAHQLLEKEHQEAIKVLLPKASYCELLRKLDLGCSLRLVH